MRSSNKICGGKFVYWGLIFNIKDTYAIIDRRLSDFKSFFGIEIEKEVFPYELYNEKNVKKGMCSIEEAIQYLKNDQDTIKFKENVKKLKLMIDDKNFNHIGYARYYCERDIEVMMKGYFIFKEWVLNDLGINIDNFLTISSISDRYFKEKECYSGCKYICGIARYYIQKTVVGGRCMSSQNKKYLLENNSCMEQVFQNVSFVLLCFFFLMEMLLK